MSQRRDTSWFTCSSLAKLFKLLKVVEEILESIALFVSWPFSIGLILVRTAFDVVLHTVLMIFHLIIKWGLVSGYYYSEVRPCSAFKVKPANLECLFTKSNF